MKNCPQTDNQSVFEHGQSVQNYTLKIIDFLNNSTNLDFHVPDWLQKYRKEILFSIYDIETIKEYTLYHDVGKIFCIQYIDGKRHFPNHAQESYNIWKDINITVAHLMLHDMDIHIMKDKDIDDFIKLDKCITHLIVGLAEVISNATMFGGFDSTSFKIKFKQIEKRGNAVLKKLFGDK